MSDHSVNKTELKIQVELDETKIPVQIRYQSQDASGAEDWKEMKAFALALFEGETKETYKIDLWTRDMQVNEMDRFVFNTLKGLADSYYRATKNEKLANDFQSFIHHFGKSTQII